MSHPWFAALAIAALALSSPDLAAAASPLDGKTFAVQMMDGDKKMDADAIVFANGFGESPGIAKRYKFEKGKCTTTTVAGGVTFTFAVTSGEHGNVEFTGTVAKDGSISGKRTWSKPDKPPIVHTFTGTVK